MLTTATMASVKDGLLNARSCLSTGMPGGAAGGRSLTPTAMTTVKTAAERSVRPNVSLCRGGGRSRFLRRTQKERDAEPAEPRDLLERPGRGADADDDGRDDRPDLQRTANRQTSKVLGLKGRGRTTVHVACSVMALRAILRR